MKVLFGILMAMSILLVAIETLAIFVIVKCCIVFLVCCLLWLSGHRVYLFQRADFYLLLFVIMHLLSIFWGDLSVSNILVQTGFLFSYVGIYLVVRLLKPNYLNLKFLWASLIAESALYYYDITNEENNILGSYVIGTTSVFLLTISKASIIQKFGIFMINLLFSGGRFALACLTCLTRKPRINIAYIVLVFFLLIVATELASSTAQERFLGYRTSEYIAFAIEKDSLFEWVLGEGLGRAESLRYLGTKGDIYHSGYYHNYLLTITESLGLIGGVLLCMILPSSKAKFGDLNLRAIWISWLVICCIEAPRDGAWPLFFISALGANREEKREIALKSGW